jgi:ribosome biogenesis GTPase
VLPALHAENLAVGDWVLSTTLAHDEHWLCALLPPVTHIARRGNDGRHHSLVSNVDTAPLVMGLITTSIRAGWNAIWPSSKPPTLIRWS